MAIFGARDASGASFFDGIYDVFCTRLNFYIKKCNFKNNQKITKKSICRWCLFFDGICDVLCTSSTLQKRAVFVPPGAGRRHMAPPPIAKAKAMPQGCSSICPASDALCIAGFKTGWRLWPPTRAISPGRGSRLSKPIHPTHIAQPCL